MTDGVQSCPSCGRGVPPGHTLCVKCGAKLDDPSTLTGPTAHSTLKTRQRVLATVAVVALIAGLGAVIWLLTADSSKPPRRPTRAPRATSTTTDAASPARATPPARPTLRRDAGAPLHVGPPSPGMRPHAPGTIPLHPAPPAPGADAGVHQPLPKRPVAKTPRSGFVADLRRCVDAERRTAESDCASIRRYLGQTAESACLWSKIVQSTWRCLKKKVKRAGKCVSGCAARGAACVTGCVSKTERKVGESTTTCLLRCWRQRIDPCLGKCTRP